VWDFFWLEGLVEVGFFGGSFGLGVMEGLGGWLVGGRAGILKSRMGSFFGLGVMESWGACLLLYGPGGGRISDFMILGFLEILGF
jgi:hypothetical protein